MPVFVILECGLYHEKNGIYTRQNVVETCWKHGGMILCYLLVFLFFNLIKTAAKFMRTESVNVQRVRYSPSREQGTCILCHSVYLQVIKVHWFKLFDKPGLLCSLAESLHYFVLLSENQNAFAQAADFEFELILYSRIETTIRFFAKIYT